MRDNSDELTTNVGERMYDARCSECGGATAGRGHYDGCPLKASVLVAALRDIRDITSNANKRGWGDFDRITAKIDAALAGSR
jgi:hypothetical protein